MQETQVQSLGWKEPPEREMGTHSSILAWRIPWTEEPGRLQSLGLQRVGHDVVTLATKHTHSYYLADSVSWVPRLTLLDLRTDWTLNLLSDRARLYAGDLLYPVSSASFHLGPTLPITIFVIPDTG